MATGDGISMVVKSHEKLCILPTVRGEKSGSRCRWKSLEWSSRKWKALHSWLEGHWNQSRTYLLPDLGTLGKVGYYGKNDQLQEETMQWKELGVAAPVTMIPAQRKYRN